MFAKGKTKPWLSFSNQLKLLIDRGLIVEDPQRAEKTLQFINYYRLSAYSLTLRKDDKFYKGITFDDIVELYNFDSEFRTIILKYTSIIEIAFRTYVSYHHSQKYGPLGYLNKSYFCNERYHTIFIEKLQALSERSNDVFVTHHKKDLNEIYPFWVAIEVTTFDVLSKLYKNMLSKDKNEIAYTYCHVSRMYVENWLQCSVVARNIAAHGGRFYNRGIDSCPVKLPRYLRGQMSATTPFAFSFAIYGLLPSVESKINLLTDLENLFKSHPFALKKHLGFSEEWKDILSTAQNIR